TSSWDCWCCRWQRASRVGASHESIPESRPAIPARKGGGTMIQITHRYTGRPLYTSETASSLREAVVQAVVEGANLAGADLADAYLAGAHLAGANLAGADLADAYLADAYLAGAHLAGADLAGACLAGANLAGA